MSKFDPIAYWASQQQKAKEGAKPKTAPSAYKYATLTTGPTGPVKEPEDEFDEYVKILDSIESAKKKYLEKITTEDPANRYLGYQGFKNGPASQSGMAFGQATLNQGLSFHHGGGSMILTPASIRQRFEAKYNWPMFNGLEAVDPNTVPLEGDIFIYKKSAGLGWSLPDPDGALATDVRICIQMHQSPTERYGMDWVLNRACYRKIKIQRALGSPVFSLPVPLP